MKNNLTHPAYLIQKDQSYPSEQLVKVYGEHHNINIKGLYIMKYNAIPNHYDIGKIDVEKSLNWFTTHFSALIQNSYHYKRQSVDNDEELLIDDTILECGEDAILYFNLSFKTVEICYRKCSQEWIDTVSNGILKFLLRDHKNKIGIITKTRFGLDVESFEIKSQSTDLALNYNQDLLPVHDVIVNRLKKEGDKGIVLLHGEPGTGKTSYIRHLISQIDKEIIFVSAHIAEHLNSPDFMSFLINHKNSVLVIEDAERILIHRDYSQESPVAALLNISDGLLSDCLNIQLICSFNTDLSKIDSALLRKGRLIAKYEFKALSCEKANAIARHLGLDYQFIQPTKLTDIYNESELYFEITSSAKAVGF